jgi:alpha-ketoglutarate-dependent taurine dioxygenase
MSNPFDLDDNDAYLRWRDDKLACAPCTIDDLIVEVSDPRALLPSERAALCQRINQCNMAIYASPVKLADTQIPRLLGKPFGLDHLDANWLADGDGVSQIRVFDKGTRQQYIPYTDKPIKWHTDGYYNPSQRNILSMVLHCVHRAGQGGENQLMDHEMAYLRLRDADPEFVRVLSRLDAMTIPERTDENGVARAAQSGPVFSVQSGQLHMRYTARTRSILWHSETHAAVKYLEQILATDNQHIYRGTLESGMGLLCNNVLHDRTAFIDDPQHPRLLYRARFLDRISTLIPN